MPPSLILPCLAQQEGEQGGAQPAAGAEGKAKAEGGEAPAEGGEGDGKSDVTKAEPMAGVETEGEGKGGEGKVESGGGDGGDAKPEPMEGVEKVEEGAEKQATDGAEAGGAAEAAAGGGKEADAAAAEEEGKQKPAITDAASLDAAVAAQVAAQVPAEPVLLLKGKSTKDEKVSDARSLGCVGIENIDGLSQQPRSLECVRCGCGWCSWLLDSFVAVVGRGRVYPR